MYVVVVQKFTFAISSPDEFLFLTLWLVLYIVAMIIAYIVSVCDACAIVHVTNEVPSSRSHSSSC